MHTGKHAVLAVAAGVRGINFQHGLACMHAANAHSIVLRINVVGSILDTECTTTRKWVSRVLSAYALTHNI